MLRLAILCSLLAACERSKPISRDPAPRALEAVLACVVERVIDHARLSRAPHDTLALATDVAQVPTDRSAATRYLTALAEGISSARPELRGVPPPVALAEVAQSLVAIGARDEARRVADRALASSAGLSAGDRASVLRACALVHPAAGAEPPRAVLEGDDPIAKLYAVQGLARSGRKDRARSLLAGLARPTDLAAKGAYLVAVAWLGDLKAAGALIAAEPGPEPYLRSWLARALVESGHPRAKQILDANLLEIVATASQAATPDELLATGAAWSELVWFREQLDRASARAARRQLDDWLLSKADVRRELLGPNIVRAAVAGDPSEAARLEKALAQPLAAMPRIELALLRDDLAGSLAILSDHLQERASLYRQTRPSPDPILFDAIETAEVTVWLILAARPSVDGAIVDRFRALACAPSGQGTTQSRRSSTSRVRSRGESSRRAAAPKGSRTCSRRPHGAHMVGTWEAL